MRTQLCLASLTLDVIFLPPVVLSATLTTIPLGRILPQVNAANWMLDYIIMALIAYIPPAIEMRGLLHSVSLVQFVRSFVPLS